MFQLGKSLVYLVAACALFATTVLWGMDEETRKELDNLRKEVEGYRKEKAASKPIAPSVDKVVDNKYGPGASVTTKTGKLTISGLLQVWYYSIQNDNLGVFGDLTPGVAGGGDTNEGKDNDSFRVRRAELKFTMDIHENITAVIMFDPAREASSFPSFSTNLGTATRGRTSTLDASAVQGGTGTTNKIFQDGFINYHGVIPHHDVQIGQYKPQFGEEGIRSSGELDFVERSMLGQLGDKRDIGMHVHGTWWEDRFQYWVGLFNAPGNLHGSGGDFQNRSDDNDEKDLVYRILLRPLWKDECWGSLELGMSSQFGIHGESGNQRPDGADAGTDPDGVVDGLNRRQTMAMRHDAWAMYKPGGPVQGWWLRGEWAWIKDRNAPLAVRGFTAGLNNGTTQDSPNPFVVSGWYFATGYKISDSAVKCHVPTWFHPFEFLFRYETFDNITVGDLDRPEQRTDVFSSQVFTAGVNYYIKGDKTKIQANYNWALEDDDHNKAARGMREVRNDSFVVNFQVAW